MPQRIQRQRVKGWRMPESAVYVGRPTVWANPFVIKATAWAEWRVVDSNGWSPARVEREYTLRSSAHDYAVALFTKHTGPFGLYEYSREMLDRLRRDLGGRDLVCWCPLQLACHADVLLELANKVKGTP